MSNNQQNQLGGGKGASVSWGETRKFLQPLNEKSLAGCGDVVGSLGISGGEGVSAHHRCGVMDWQTCCLSDDKNHVVYICPRDPISLTETENGSMEAKYLAVWRWLYTPIILWRSVIGSLGLFYLWFCWFFGVKQIFGEGLLSYCWWKKSCTTHAGNPVWFMRYLHIFTISTGEFFPDFFHPTINSRNLRRGVGSAWLDSSWES